MTTARTIADSVLVRRVSAALLLVLALPTGAIAVSALSKLTRDHLDADRTQIAVFGVLQLLLAVVGLVAAAVLVRQPHAPRPPR